jgi:uncharacterized damage-inducible protein DinB
VTDAMVSAARGILDGSVQAMRSAIDGAPPEALNWRPVGPETNSIAVLAVHAITSSRMWLSIAVDAPEPERDRDAEFRTEATGADDLLATFDGIAADCRAALSIEKTIDWASERTPSRRPSSSPQTITAGWTLLHALEHLREHVAHLELTRQLWDSRPV